MSVAERIAALPPDQRAKALAVVRRKLGPLRLRYANITPFARQEAFLRLMRREAFYGGAAGPGKSTALILGGLQFVDVPRYSALLLRSTYPELTQAGGLIPRSHELLDETDAVWNEGRKEWTFPSSATLSFGHLSTPEAMRRYFGGERQYVGIDEVTGFTLDQYRRLFRLLRRPSELMGLASAPDGLTLADVPLRMRSASNPGGPGHEWARRRFVRAETRREGVAFVKALMTDNPYLDVEDYRLSLAELAPLERQRLEEGDWEIVEAGTVFSPWWLRVEQAAPPLVREVRRWDLAATEPGPSSPDPSFTVGLRYGIDRNDEFWITDVVRERLNAGAVENLVAATAQRDGRRVPIGINKDPAQAGKSQVEHYVRRVLKGYNVRGYAESGDKVTRASIVSAAAANRLVHVLDRVWLDEFLDEVRSFPAGHDDQIDAWSGAHDQLLNHTPSPAQTAVPSGRIG